MQVLGFDEIRPYRVSLKVVVIAIGDEGTREFIKADLEVFRVWDLQGVVSTYGFVGDCVWWFLDRFFING